MYVASLPEARDRSSMAAEIAAQKLSNRNALPHFDAFAGHREHSTNVASTRIERKRQQRLCVLGAGNCHDLDLARLSQVYAEIHLVDIDDEALEGAWKRQAADVRDRVFRHAPVDLSGLGGKLDRWAEMRVLPEEILRHPAATCEELVARLPGPFDVVLSSCVLTQLQWAVLKVLSPAHRLFAAVREISNLTHLRTLAALCTPGGRAVIVTDFASSDTYPLAQMAASGDVHDLFRELVDTHQGIHVAHPHHLAWVARNDPVLQRSVRMSAPLDAWLWQNGPERLFLVYAVELRRLEIDG